VSTVESPTTAASIDAATRMGVVALSVASLDRSLRYYTEAIGLAVLRRSGPEAILGVAGTPLLVLQEQPGALPWMTDNMTGLYHFAILVPTRADLGAWLRHYLTTSNPPPGQGDHVVSEALYLRDPDGHGIEVYADRPREGWEWTDGQVRMGGGPVDVRSMMKEGEALGLWTGMRPGTTMGHVHLQVGDIDKAEAFHHGVLGFDVVARMPTALFVSAGGYHHHLGMNTWHSKGTKPAPADTATLRYYAIVLPSAEALAPVLARLADAGIAFHQVGDEVVLRDPWLNMVVLHTGPLADAATAAAMETAARRAPAG
jgi:catechol 2,3-dioxygenase